MRRQLASALRMTVALIAMLGLAYPLVVTGLAQALFPDQADGSFVRDRNHVVVGSSLIGQPFTHARYFHSRPSAAGDGYDALASGASNLGPSNPELLNGVAERAAAYRAEHGLAADAAVPADAVTASASGLDPHISPANARLQAGRVGAARAVDLEQVLALVDQHTDGPLWGFLGERTVNVLELNLALDAMA